MKKIFYTLIGISLIYGIISTTDITLGISAKAETSTKSLYSTPVSEPTTVNSLDVVRYPQKYLNKTITMKATFDKFSTLGLDYKPAMRSSQDYIGILIKREDVVDHTVPLSEMKMFLKRDLAEKNINLESDDKIQITGKVFSTALGDPWIDITEIKVLQKAPKTDKK